MVKKVINVGVEGNDATGDPLREAFIKTNENFNELYSAIGAGDGIPFTALSDTPDALEPNNIFIVNSAGTEILGKGLKAGEGIDINLTNSNDIIITNTGASLVNDPNPALANTLDASTFGIARLGDPDPLDASNLAIPLNSYATSKGYTDDRYVRRGGNYEIASITKGTGGRLTVTTVNNHRVDSGDLIVFSGIAGMIELNTGVYYAKHLGLKTIELYSDPALTILINGSSFGNYASGGVVTVKTVSTSTNPIAVPAGATGTQVPQKQEVVGRAGGTDNQMQGALILAEDPDEFSNPLTAVTKNYVDTSSFASTVNLYVSTTGNDSRFEVLPSKRGRALAYAFKSINRAAQEAQYIISRAATELGPYQKPITFVNGNFRSTVAAVGPDTSPNTYLLDITHGGTGTDPRQPADGNFDIRSGLLIRGVTSGAIGLIEDIGAINLINNTERYHVHYVATDENNNYIPFALGEELEYGEPVKAPNITIFIESGTYYDHFPIKVPENVSIQGDELRRVIVRPRFGRSASPWNNLFFRRDLFIDGIDTVPPFDDSSGNEFGRHYLTNPTRPLYSKTINNPGRTTINPNGFENARAILTSNREFIQEEVIGFIAATLDGLDYDQVEWTQDLGRVIDAVIYDMAVGSNYASITAGMYYRRGPNGNHILGFEKNAKVQTLGYLKTVLSGLASSDATAQTRIQNNMDLVINILNNGLSAVPGTFTRPEPNNITLPYQLARTLIVSNANFIKAEIIAYINRKYPSLSYDEDTYRQNLQYIIDALYYDLTYNGNSQSVSAGKDYYIYGQFRYSAAEKIAIVDAYENHLKTLVFNIAQNLAVSPEQTAVSQISGTPGSLNAANDARNLIEDIKDIIQTNVAPLSVFPGLSWQDAGILSAVTTLASNKTSTQTNVINWVNSNFFIYNSDLCRRDAGLIVDALAFDLANGGYFKSLEAANSYFESASSLIAITTQLTETSAALSYLGTIAQRIVQKLPVLISYQTTYTQKRTFDFSAEAGATTAIADLVQLHLDVINQDPSFNPPLNNEDMDVFLMNNATILRNFSVQGHGGFMCVLDPEGQIITKSPYVQTCGSFSRSTNLQRFSGGQFVDGFAGNLECEVITRTSSTKILVGGLTYRKPQTPCSFFIQGVRFQVDFIGSYDATTGTGILSLNPNTPDLHSYHGLGNPLDPNSFIITPGLDLELITAGNRSMLSNDFTQINDMGYGLVATNQGLIEAVSVFTYYCYTAYYSLNGGQIRSLNGSCAYGVNALKAEGSDPLEVPDEVVLQKDMVRVVPAYTDIASGIDNEAGKFVIYVTVPLIGGKPDLPPNFSEAEVHHGLITTTSITNITSSTAVPFALTLTSTAGILPDSIIKINSEYFNVSANDIVTNTLTITARAQLSSTAANHSPGSTVIAYGSINRYEITTIRESDAFPPGVIGLNINTGGNQSVAGSALAADIPNGTPIIIRSNQSFGFSDIANVLPVRPSTALQFQNESKIYRVLSYNNVNETLKTASLRTREVYDYARINITREVGALSVPGTNGVGDTIIRCGSIDSEQLPTVIGKKFAWGNSLHRILSYTPPSGGNPYALIGIDTPLDKSLNGYPYTVTLRAGLPAGALAEITVNISTMRATGHDMLDIGTGSFASSNYPNNIFGKPNLDPNQNAEVREVGKGRVFYVTTDQDGNFRVGTFFTVDQGTGSVSFAASITLTNLDGLGFKDGVPITAFSDDEDMDANSTSKVPIERAVRSYVDKRLGLSHTGTVLQPSDNPIGPGYMPRNGQLAATANMDLGSQRIINLQAPASLSDAANKNYVDNVLTRVDTNRNGVLGFTMINDSTIDTGAIDMNGNRIKSMRDPVDGSDAATKQYVDAILRSKDTVSELTDVSISSISSSDILSWNAGTNRWNNAKLVDANVSNTAAIAQSKLNLLDATAAATVGSAIKGIASYSDASFSVTSGFVTIKNGGISVSQIQNLASKTVVGNSATVNTAPTAVDFSTVVQDGNGLYKGLFGGPTTLGALVKTAADTWGVVEYTSAATASTIVSRDTSGNFSGNTINANTQYNLNGNKILDAATGTAVVYGTWTLGASATLEATYAADLAEYYEGDKSYEVGTVLMLGGDKEVTLAKGEGTRAVAGVVSNNAAYIMNGACPGEKNLIALQGRVPCKVIGKIKKGDLLVVSMIPGVAMASEDPKTGSIIGKAIQDYDSDRIGLIEVMVGKH